MLQNYMSSCSAFGLSTKVWALGAPSQKLARTTKNLPSILSTSNSMQDPCKLSFFKQLIALLAPSDSGRIAEQSSKTAHALPQDASFLPETPKEANFGTSDVMSTAGSSLSEDSHMRSSEEPLVVMEPSFMSIQTSD